MQFFPDRFRAWCTVETNGTLAAVSSYAQTFKVNAPVVTFGPRVNFSGSFGSNAPSGVSYLISGLSDTAASGPYSQYLVRRYEMRVTVASASTAANSVPFIGGITFSPNLTATNAMSVTQLPEQPRTMSVTIPHLTTNQPIVVANSVKICEMVGLTDQLYAAQHSAYAGTVLADPAVPLYAQLWFRAIDGSTTGTYQFLVRHRFEIEFFNLNSFTTIVPSLESKSNKSGWSLM